MSDRDSQRSESSDGKQLLCWTRRDGEDIICTATLHEGEPELTPNDPRWQEQRPPYPPDWLPPGWQGDYGWPSQQPTDLADIDRWLAERRQWWTGFQDLASEDFVAERLRRSLYNAARLVEQLGFIPPDPPPPDAQLADVEAGVNRLRRWLRDPSYQWERSREGWLKERELAQRPGANDTGDSDAQTTDRQQADSETDGPETARVESADAANTEDEATGPALDQKCSPMSPEEIRTKAKGLAVSKVQDEGQYKSMSQFAREVGCSVNARAFREVCEWYEQFFGWEHKKPAATTLHDGVGREDEALERLRNQEIETLQHEQEAEMRSEGHARRPTV